MKKFILSILLFVSFSTVSSAFVSQTEVIKLYIATFDRAPDKAGLDYWVNNSGLEINQIAQSFFDQPETQELYPSDSTDRDFINAIYLNIFGRESDEAGLNYWLDSLKNGMKKSVMLEALKNGAIGDDAILLENKTKVAQAFVNANLNNATNAKRVLANITADYATVTVSLDFILSLMPPINPKIISLNSPKIDTITLFWLKSIDRKTPTASIKYEIHLSTDSNFTISSATLKQTLSNILEADISQLERDTIYYVKIKAIDDRDNFSISKEESISTLAQEVQLDSNASIKTASELSLKNAVETEDKLIFEDSANAIIPRENEILIGDSENSYLKKVISVTKDNGQIEIETKNATISDVIDTAKISSKTILFGDTENDSTSGELNERSVRYKVDNKKESTTTWKSGRFSVTDVKNLNVDNKTNFRTLNVSNNQYSIKIVKDDITVKVGETIQIDIETTMKQAGIEDGYRFKSIKLISLTHPDKNHNDNFGAWYSTIQIKSAESKGYLKWTPKKSYADVEKYTATFEVIAEDKECDDTFDLCDEKKETVKSKILVIGDGTVDSGGQLETSFTQNKEFTNDVTIDFTPTLIIEHELDGKNLKYAKIELNGKLNFDVLTKFKYDVSQTTKYDKNLLTKKYTSVYMAGTVPIYQEITFTLDAEFESVATGSIEAISDLDTDFTIGAGMEFDGTKWNPIAYKNLEKDYTATIKAEGGVNVKIRIIPNIEIKFYKVASAGLSVEPWLEGDLKASATATLNTDFESYDTLGIHKVENLDLEVGIDVKVYADLSIWKFNLAHYPSDGDKKTISNPDDWSWKLFSIPEIELSKSSENICDVKSLNIKANITDGVNNPFSYDNLSWFVFPQDGATIIPNTDSKEATFKFSKQDEYQIYFVGNSEVLGDVFGKQYEYLTIDTRDCTIQEGKVFGKWIKPSQSICENGGGIWNDYGNNECFANWENAKNICSASEGVLPTIEVLEQVVIDCGGISYKYEIPREENIANESYQACYKSKGFTDTSYWSSTADSSNTNNAWLVDFYYGNADDYVKNSIWYVRCVRGETPMPSTRPVDDIEPTIPLPAHLPIDVDAF